MYTLYTIPGSCSSGITVLLEKLQVPYTPVKREDVENYAELVPTNQVPALRTPEGQIVTEGAAIVLYLLEKHEAPMLPGDLERKAEFLRWLMFDYATMHPAYGRMFAIRFRVRMDENERTGVLKQLAGQVSSLWAILDKELERKRFITGDEPTIVDYLAAVYASWGKNFPDAGIVLGNNVKRLIDEVSVLPEFRAGYKKENLEYHKPF
ncbi:glutathione S-transferase family protein [Desulfofustis limnaeus]|jgi:glutathione S-transferase|uniref:Glutathione S-transferase n=1 Tax=Desulfofustis limnaeus TaxID=2740163 RepID=A0ABN6MB20_9BACT|nr:glutathione S-transferase family protein [Desulfofustis limnaeus]MDY0040803.1 glutathione S-transferase family protein [Desulforhabdus sp.]BDD88667.1 glutathione S-transferase [Desulfofustis limnaeus]